jgi:hypothetical protein
MHPISQTTKTPEIQAPWEPHYSIGQLSKLWGFSRTTLRCWFEREAGVLRQGETRLRRGRRRPYVSLRIPESIAQKVYAKHTEVG